MKLGNKVGINMYNDKALVNDLFMHDKKEE